MPPIPGANRLGQGIPGGRAGLPGDVAGGNNFGLPTIPGGIRPISGGTIPGTPVSAPPLSAPVASPPPQQDTVPSAKAMGLASAMAILDRVRAGQMEPSAASKLMTGIDESERRQLMLMVHRRADQHGDDPGSVNAQLQALDPKLAGKSPGFTTASFHPGAGKGVGSHLLQDVSDTITGTVPGLALAAKAVGEDLGHIVAHPLSTDQFQHTTNEILKPIAHQYGQTYGHGLGGFVKSFKEHPLGPMMDALALVSAGAGTAGRVGAASDALKAGRVASSLDKHIPMKVNTAHQEAITGLWDHLDNNPNFDVDHFESLLNRLGEHAHPEYNYDYQGSKQIQDPHAFVQQLGGIAEYARSLAQGPAELKNINRLIDKVYSTVETKVPVDVMKLAAGPPRSLTGDLFDLMQKDPTFDEGKLVPGHPANDPLDKIGRQDPHELFKPYEKRSTAKVGDDYTVGSQDNGLWSVTKAGTVEAPATGYVRLYRGEGSARVSNTPEWMTANRGRWFTTDKRVAERYSAERSGHVKYVDVPEASLADYEVAGGSGAREFVLPDPLVSSAQVMKAGTVTHANLPDEATAIRAAQHGATGFGKAPTTKADELRVPLSEWTPDKLKDLGGVSYISAARDPETGKIYSTLENHEAMSEHLEQELGDKAWDGLDQFTVVVDPKSGKVLQVNHADPHADKLTPTDPSIASDVKKQVEAKFASSSPSIKPMSKARLALTGAAKAGPQGSLIDAYEGARGISHEAEIQNAMKEVADVLDNPNLRLNRRSVREVASDVAADLRQTRAEGKARPSEMAANLPGFISPGSTGRALSVGETSLREASDLIRAGAIYLRPAYLPNNWAGNAFMNLSHQGFFAPLNLAKSLVLDKHIGARYTRAMDASMGQNAAEVITAPKGRGYIGSVTSPVAHVMGALADQPFRRAAFLHEARRAGYGKLSEVKALFDRASGHELSADGEKALREIADISRKAQEEIVKFGHMNDTERSIIRNLVFVYSWIRGAGRYTGRFPFQHPMQAASATALGQDVGTPWMQKEMGGVPSYLVGSVPVGRDKNGNPILINPFTLNPLGTGLQIIQAASGTFKVAKPIAESLLRGKVPASNFNKYAEQDLVNLLNPLAQTYLSSHEGTPPNLQSSVAALRLIHDLRHPNSGSVYPTSRSEAIGHFTVGSLYPRRADQQAITHSLERENRDNPLALIPTQLDQYKKATGNDVPPEFVKAYQADLVAVQQQKDFKSAYATDHGSSGFRSLPAQNQAEAAIQYLEQHHLVAPADLAQIKEALSQMTTDQQYQQFANSLWSSTGAGTIKRAWGQLISSSKGQQLTRKR